MDNLSIVKAYKVAVLELDALKLAEELSLEAKEHEDQLRSQFDVSFYSLICGVQRDDVDAMWNTGSSLEGERSLKQVAEALGLPSLSEFETEDLIDELERVEKELLFEEIADNWPC